MFENVNWSADPLMGCSGSVVNRLLLQAPESSSYSEWSFKDELLWIPMQPSDAKQSPTSKEEANSNGGNSVIPCRLVQHDSASHLLVYFHKNADDLGSCKRFCDKLSSSLAVHVLAVEYPGYGLCWDFPKTPEQICKHAFAALDFVQRTLRWPLERVIVYGACLGVGPAIAVAAQSQVAGLVLVGAFLSIRKIVGSHSRLVARCVTEKFPNEERASMIKCPTLIFHGKQDKLVPVAHAEELYQRLECPKKLVSLSDMGHHSNLTKNEDVLFGPVREFFQLPSSGDAMKPQVPAWAFQRQLAISAGTREKPGEFQGESQVIGAESATEARSRNQAEPLQKTCM